MSEALTYWTMFIAIAAVIAVAGPYVSRNGDIIAERQISPAAGSDWSSLPTQVQTTPRYAQMLDDFSVRSSKGIEHL